MPCWKECALLLFLFDVFKERRRELFGGRLFSRGLFLGGWTAFLGAVGSFTLGHDLECKCALGYLKSALPSATCSLASGASPGATSAAERLAALGRLAAGLDSARHWSLQVASCSSIVLLTALGGQATAPLDRQLFTAAYGEAGTPLAFFLWSSHQERALLPAALAFLVLGTVPLPLRLALRFF